LKFLSGNIKRVLILSSVVSIGVFKTDSEYTEEEWNDLAVDDVKTKGKASDGHLKYMASKTLAERGAGAFTKCPGSVYLCRVNTSCLGALR
jgi:hypothetical protein